MKKLILPILIFCVMPLRAATMARVVFVDDARTLTIERNGARETIHLAGVAIIDALRARDLLQWSIGAQWVMLEPSGNEWLVYRSPDALFLNRELVLRGFARATAEGIEPHDRAPFTYLGEVDPSGPQRSANTPAKPTAPRAATTAKAPKTPRSTPARRPNTRRRAG
ncbi:MAG TPA: hypothetical protein VFN10_06855 [Thermoanaerobaculia bacterium]|nr:hypothetical protein [Thermoanaerobaculia bacterium]